MSRAGRADQVLRYLMSGADAALRSDPGGGAFGSGLAALQAIYVNDPVAVGLAADALALARDPDALTLARAAAGLSIAQFPEATHDPRFADPRGGGDVLTAALDDPPSSDPDLGPALGILVVEAALACARIDLAVRLLQGVDVADTLFGRVDHPFLTFARTVRARVSAFAGEISAAGDGARAALGGARSPLEVLLAQSVSALVHGNADDREITRAVVGRVEEEGFAPLDMITRGCYVLASYGAVALGDIPRAARLILRAGGGPELGGLRIIDRVLGLELLVAAAADEGDLDAASSWLAAAMPLAGHPIAASTVARMRSRVALLGDDAASAIAWAEGAWRRAQDDGRAIEAAEASILVARAKIVLSGGGAAARDLADGAESARASGHLAFLRSASRELRGVGRRLPPSRASGWHGLSTREREVAELLAEGLSNAQIADALFLSTHTVRVHTSRVLHAFGVSSRVGVAIALAPPGRGSAALTPRQTQIVALVVAGASNRAIAEALGIRRSTVEKHVAEIMRRWGVGSRAGIVRVAGAAEPDDRRTARATEAAPDRLRGR